MPKNIEKYLNKVIQGDCLNEMKNIPGLFITANCIQGISVPACMEQGERTAHAVAEYLRRKA